LTKLYDGIEQIEDDLWGDDPLDIHASYAEDDDQVWSMDENGVWQPEVNGSEWEEFDDDAILEDDMDVDNVGWADEVVPDSPTTPASSVPYDSAPLSTPPLKGDNVKEELTWKRFDILPCTPHDHAYFSSIPSQPSKSFLGRLTKEYRVLSSSLPGLCKVR
jgi:ubiquitin-conjugating enzyme E2 O